MRRRHTWTALTRSRESGDPAGSGVENCPESGDHPDWSGGMIVKLSRTSRWWAAGLAVTMLAALIIVFANASNHTGNGASSTLFGTLDTQTKTAATEKKDGISVAMFELNWGSF